MPFHQSGSIRYYTFDHFDSDALTHAVFTRRGGVSPSPWDSLNMAITVGDEQQRVDRNRVRAFEALHRSPDSIFDVWQVHSAKVVCAAAPRDPRQPHIKADAILTDKPAVTLFMRFADCVPILLHDPVRQVVGIVHAGWQGTVRGVVPAAVTTMQERYRSDPADIRAGIGPSIGPHHYEVGGDVIAAVQSFFGDRAEKLLPSQLGAVQFDLWGANRLLLEEAGVGHIQVAGLCTACHPEDWFSHRGENGRTGRFGALIGLNENQ